MSWEHFNNFRGMFYFQILDYFNYRFFFFKFKFREINILVMSLTFSVPTEYWGKDSGVFDRYLPYIFLLYEWQYGYLCVFDKQRIFIFWSSSNEVRDS